MTALAIMQRGGQRLRSLTPTAYGSWHGGLEAMASGCAIGQAWSLALASVREPEQTVSLNLKAQRGCLFLETPFSLYTVYTCVRVGVFLKKLYICIECHAVRNARTQPATLDPDYRAHSFRASGGCAHFCSCRRLGISERHSFLSQECSLTKGHGALWTFQRGHPRCVRWHTFMGLYSG